MICPIQWCIHWLDNIIVNTTHNPYNKCNAGVAAIKASIIILMLIFYCNWAKGWNLCFRSRVFYTLPGNTNSFIMFEFGLEQISLNLARRFGFSADEKTSLRGDDSDMKRQSYHSGVASHSQQRHKHQSGASSGGRTGSFDKPSGWLFTLIKQYNQWIVSFYW